MKDSIFRSTLRSFLIGFAVTAGIIAAIFAIILALVFAFSDDTCLSSSAKIRPDAEGHRKELAATVPVILEIDITGEIGKLELTAEKIEDVLLRSREKEFAKDRVKGILLFINSPGGSAIDSDTIYNHLIEYKNKFKVPIYTFVEGLCASGGFYIACASDKISTSDTSLIGSVGVVSWPPFFNVNKVMEKLGVDSATIFAGKGKDSMNPFRPWTESDPKQYREIINFYYDKFTEIVAKGRPLVTKEKLQEDFGAKVFPAPKAKELGYIDEFGVMRNQVVKELALASGIKEGEKYQVVMLQKKSWWKTLSEEKFSLLTGKMEHQITLPDELKMEKGNPFYYIFTP